MLWLVKPLQGFKLSEDTSHVDVRHTRDSSARFVFCAGYGPVSTPHIRSHEDNEARMVMHSRWMSWNNACFGQIQLPELATDGRPDGRPLKLLPFDKTVAVRWNGGTYACESGGPVGLSSTTL